MFSISVHAKLEVKFNLNLRKLFNQSNTHRNQRYDVQRVECVQFHVVTEGLYERERGRLGCLAR